MLLVSPFLSCQFWVKYSSCDAFKHTLVRCIVCWKSPSWFDIHPLVPLYHAKCTHTSKSGLFLLPGVPITLVQVMLKSAIPVIIPLGNMHSLGKGKLQGKVSSSCLASNLLIPCCALWSFSLETAAATVCLWLEMACVQLAGTHHVLWQCLL